MEDRTNSLFNDFKKKRQESGRKAIKDEKILRKMLTNELREIKQEYRYSDQELD